jgi:hypothetical protein
VGWHKADTFAGVRRRRRKGPEAGSSDVLHCCDGLLLLLAYPPRTCNVRLWRRHWSLLLLDGFAKSRVCDLLRYSINTRLKFKNFSKSLSTNPTSTFFCKVKPYSSVHQRMKCQTTACYKRWLLLDLHFWEAFFVSISVKKWLNTTL